MGEVRKQRPSPDMASGLETKWLSVRWVPERVLLDEDRP